MQILYATRTACFLWEEGAIGCSLIATGEDSCFVASTTFLRRFDDSNPSPRSGEGGSRSEPGGALRFWKNESDQNLEDMLTLIYESLRTPTRPPPLRYGGHPPPSGEG